MKVNITNRGQPDRVNCGSTDTANKGDAFRLPLMFGADRIGASRLNQCGQNGGGEILLGNGIVLGGRRSTGET